MIEEDASASWDTTGSQAYSNRDNSGINLYLFFLCAQIFILFQKTFKIAVSGNQVVNYHIEPLIDSYWYFVITGHHYYFLLTDIPSKDCLVHRLRIKLKTYLVTRMTLVSVEGTVDHWTIGPLF